MLTEIEKTHNEPKNDIRNKIVKELKRLKYNFSYKGTKYLVDTIQYVLLII